jgi:hypothetical protein
MGWSAKGHTVTELNDLFRSTAAIFGERDRGVRIAAIDRAYTEDVLFTDPDGSVVGRDALDEKVQHLLDNAPPEFTFVEDGPLYLNGEIGALAWAFGPADAPMARGIDIMTARDGKISVLQTLLAI